MKAALALLLAIPAAPSQDVVTAWDTGQASAAPLTADEIASKAGWVATTAASKGDTVVTNGRLLVVARKQSPSLEVYSLVGPRAVSRACLLLQAPGGDPAARLEAPVSVELAKGSVTLIACFESANKAPLGARLRLRRGDVSVEVTPALGAERLRVECPTRFAVLPDFFADDILIDARKIPVAAAEVPSENFLMHLSGSGEAIAMAISESRDQEVRITLSGEKEKRVITGSEIAFGEKQKKIWLAILEAPGMWHSMDLKKEDSRKVIPLEWKMPFVAQWRVDFSRPNDLVDGWDMLLQNKKGQDYIKPAWFGGPEERLNDATRQRFTEVLGFFPYPAWSDPERKGFLQPLELTTRTKFVSQLTYQGPVVLYPLNRMKDTPPDVFTVVDVARNSLGMGPCEYVLDLENQKQEYKGQATCPTRDSLIAIYEKGQQKARREEIEKHLKDAVDFVNHIRGRIDHYVEFGRRLREYLAAEKKAHAELSEPIDELEKIVAEIAARFAEREERIKTPAHVEAMNADFRKNILDYDGPDALERCKKYAEDLVRIGGNQDKLVSECRWVARTLRQRAGLLVAVDPRMERIAREVRGRAQEALRKPSLHERARQ